MLFLKIALALVLVIKTFFLFDSLEIYTQRLYRFHLHVVRYFFHYRFECQRQSKTSETEILLYVE